MCVHLCVYVYMWYAHNSLRISEELAGSSESGVTCAWLSFCVGVGNQTWVSALTSCAISLGPIVLINISLSLKHLKYFIIYPIQLHLIWLVKYVVISPEMVVFSSGMFLHIFLFNCELDLGKSTSASCLALSYLWDSWH